MAGSSIHSLLTELKSGLESLLDEAREEGRAEVRALLSGMLSGGAAPAVRRRGPGRPKKAPAATDSATPAPAAKKPIKRRRSAWAAYSDEDYIARVNGIRTGRGMKKLTAAERRAKLAERHGTAPAKPAKKKRGSYWDKFTPEQRAERVKAMIAGRKKAARKRKRAAR